MHNIMAIFRKEMNAFFSSPMAYIFLVVFALINGYFFNIQFFLINESDMRVLFSIIPIVYLFFIPAVSMGLISREKGIGTIEIISTLPINERDIVLGKYLAGFSLILLGLATTLFFYLNLVYVGSNIDHGAVFTGYIGLALLGGVYTSIGLFSSSLTENQVIAFIIGIAISGNTSILNLERVKNPAIIINIINRFAATVFVINQRIIFFMVLV